jgi:chromosome partitioning protein
MSMHESCTVCGSAFEVQFRYQMEERDGGFSFYCSQACHERAVRGDAQQGVTCDACGKRFSVELVSQIVRVKTARRYACGEACRSQILAEAGGARLSSFATPPPPAPEERDSNVFPIAGQASAAEVPAAPDSAPVIAAPVARISDVRDLANDVPAAPTVTVKGPKKLAVFNHKGGTGKTTTSVSIAAGLAQKGVKVLLVDTDSQGNVGVSLGVKAEKSLYHVLVMGLSPMQAAINVRPNFDVLVSNETLAAAELYLAGRQNRDRILRERLAATADAYDVVVLDCSPSLSLLNQNSLVFADGILVPVACDFLSLVGVRQVIKTVKNVNQHLRHPVQIFGVLPTFYDARARICRDAVETLKEHFGDRCLSPVRAATKVKEAPAQGKTLFEYAPESNAAEDYMAVVDRIIAGGPAAVAETAEPARRAGTSA